MVKNIVTKVILAITILLFASCLGKKHSVFVLKKLEKDIRDDTFFAESVRGSLFDSIIYDSIIYGYSRHGYLSYVIVAYCDTIRAAMWFYPNGYPREIFTNVRLIIWAERYLEETEKDLYRFLRITNGIRYSCDSANGNIIATKEYSKIDPLDFPPLNLTNEQYLSLEQGL